jgi:hypothetical protein
MKGMNPPILCNSTGINTCRSSSFQLVQQFGESLSEVPGSHTSCGIAGALEMLLESV